MLRLLSATIAWAGSLCMAACSPSADADSQEGPITLGLNAGPGQLGRFYESEATRIVKCIARQRGDCAYPNIANATVDASAEDIIAPLGTLDAKGKERLAARFASYEDYIMVGTSVRVPPPYARRWIADPPIPPELLKDTTVDVSMDLVNEITEPGLRLRLTFQNGQLNRLNVLETHPRTGKIHS